MAAQQVSGEPSRGQHKQRAKRVSRILKDISFENALSNLRAICLILSEVDEFCVPSVSESRLHESLRGPYMRLKQSRSHASELYEVLSSPRCWQCTCSSRHNLKLELQKDPHWIASDSITLSIPHPHSRLGQKHVSMRSIHLQAATSRLDSRTRGELSLEDAVSNDLYCEESHTTVNLSQRSPDRSARHLGSNDETSPGISSAVNARRSVSSYEASVDSIRDICHILQTYPLKGDGHHIGYLCKATASSKYPVVDAGVRVTAAQFADLRSTVCEIRYHNRKDCFEKSNDLPMGARLSCAATLASNVFQL